MTDYWNDIAEESHYNDEKISEYFNEWVLLKKEIKFDDSETDDIKINRLRSLEFEIDSYIEDHATDSPYQFEWMRAWSPLTKEEKRNLQKNQGGRPKNLLLEETKERLRKRYYQLKNKAGHSKKDCLNRLHKEFPQWTISTIETYLK